MKTNSLILLLVVTLVCGWATATADAQDDAGRRGRPAGAGSQESQEARKDDKADDKASESPVLALVGGDVMTVTGPVIRRGTVLVQDGKILKVGSDLSIPEGATVLDVSGKVITPGFVSISMQGVGIRATPGGRDQLADALDPFDRNMKYSLGVGITSGCVELSSGRGGGRRRPREGEAEERFPGLDPSVQDYVTEAILDYGDINTSLCPCCGLPVLPTEPIEETPPAAEQPRSMAVIKLSYGNLEDMLMKEDVFYSPAPGALNGALNRHNWRRDLKRVRDSLKEKEAEAAKPGSSSGAGNTGGRPAGSNGPGTGTRGGAAAGGNRGGSQVNQSLVPLVKGEVAVRVRANTADEILDMVDLARELDYRVVIEGGVEAWVIADQLGAAKASVIYTPRQRRAARDDRPERSGSYIESTRIFEETGIPFAIAPLANSVSMNGLAGRDLTSLPLEAAFGVRGGASEQAALESITIVPARMMGLEDRIGSIEEGKDADLLILNGGPLDYRTYVEKAIVAGKVAYERDGDKVYPTHQRQ